MSNTVQLQRALDLASLDALTSKLKRSGESAAELLAEHVTAAHAYILGAMPEECSVNLDLAEHAADALSDKTLRQEVKGVTSRVARELRVSAQRRGSRHMSHCIAADHEFSATAEGLAEFFHGTDVTLGGFYPVQHVVAVFASWERALAGRQLLLEAGLQPGDVLAVPGPDEVASFLEDRREHRGAWARLAALFSWFLDTEAVLVDRYIHWARRGAGFLFAYSRTEDDLNRIADTLQSLSPIAMHGFLTGCIHHLI